MRPVLDEVLGELGASDRETILLRYFEGRDFASVGAKLNVTDNTARMRVERALDKLRARLARRGVTSTSAALAVALSNQAVVAAPAGLAATITSAAMVGTAASSVMLAGLIASMSTAKILAGIAGVVAIGGIGTALFQQQRLSRAESAVEAAGVAQAAMAARLADTESRLQRAQKRAEEAEEDTGQLLRAVESTRATKAPSALTAAAANAFSPVQSEQLAYERAYQQALAKSRAAEAMSNASAADSVSRMDLAQKFKRLIELAEQHLARAEFQAGIRVFNQAMSVKPAETPVTENIERLQVALLAQKSSVPVSVRSDGLTCVTISPDGGILRKFDATVVSLTPGDYEVIGQRRGFQDARLPLRVRAGGESPVLTVVCGTPTNP